MRSAWRRPMYCSTWMPTMTAPIAHAGMPKKNRANGYSAMNTRNTASSTGLEAGLRDVQGDPEDAGDDGDQQQEQPEPHPPEHPFDLPAEVPEDGDA